MFGKNKKTTPEPPPNDDLGMLVDDKPRESVVSSEPDPFVETPAETSFVTEASLEPEPSKNRGCKGANGECEEEHNHEDVCKRNNGREHFINQAWKKV